MRRPKEKRVGKEDLFVGIDLHKQRWHVTIRTLDVEVFSASLPLIESVAILLHNESPS
jgi:hypothetical protein